MERLTEYESIAGHAHAIITGDLDKAIMRLADYEDTGLEPAEVHSMHGEWNAMMAALNSIGGGYGRLRELAEADKEGRLVVLPCRAGDGLPTKEMKVSGLPNKEKAIEAWNRRVDNG